MVGMLTLGAWLIGCGGEPAEPVAETKNEIPEKCKAVHVDRLAGDWVLARGPQADVATRLRVFDDGNGGYTGWYTGGAFTKVEMRGTKKADEGVVLFVEQPTAEKQRKVAADAASLAVLHITPDLPSCALKVQKRTQNAGGKQEIEDKVEFLKFPDAPGVTFAWQPAGEYAFVGEAAKDKKKADAEITELGEPKPDVFGGTVPVGAFSDAAADGADTCTFDMDLYFDDQLAKEKVPAGEIKDGVRRWYQDWEAPYSGNHYFEIYRYATCGGDRKLLGIAGISAVLM